VIRVANIAFVLINAEAGEEGAVLESLEEIPEVKETWSVYGVYDIITKVETENLQLLKEIVSSKIRRIETVRSTLTMIIA